MDQHDQALLKILHRDLWIFSLLMVLFTILTVFQHNLFWLTIITFLGSLYWAGKYFLRNNKISFPHGPANVVTMIRFCMITATALLHTSLSAISLGMLFVVVCIGDIVDGRLARALNKTSTIGEYLDKETDALFVLFASIILYLHDFFGIWVIVLGLIRYVYFLIMYFFIQPNQKEKKDPAARVIAGVVFSGILSSFFIPVQISGPILMVSVILLIYSFGRSVFIETGMIQ
ncbi:MAG: CDP-alcohol phosphatidyltransferase family protein [Saprospiraceae bacterium]